MKVPKGWRKLRKTDVVRPRDKWLSGSGRWIFTTIMKGNYKAGEPWLGGKTYIRRIKRK